MQEAKGFALYGKNFAVNKQKSKDELALEKQLKEQIEKQKTKSERTKRVKNDKIREAKLRLARRKAG